MFNFFVSHLIEESFVSAVEIHESRFLEYTSDAIRNELESLSVEAIECLKAWPCLLLQEGRGEEVVHVAKIETIQLDARMIKLTLVPVLGRALLVNDAIWKMRNELDIAEFEFNRNHWAVKDRDLVSVLTSAGYAFESAGLSSFENRPLPAPSRRELMQARKVIGNWSHTEIDDFLLETGVVGLEASRDIGSRRDRANAAIEFALSNPSATTAENSLLTAYIVRVTSGAEEEVDGASQEFPPAVAVDLVPAGSSRMATNGRDPNRVFIVHGQNEFVSAAVVTELERLGLEPIVLHEQPSMGRHLLTKFIEEAELVTFAVVLMTDDDVGSIKDGAVAPRARQNVILELGYFLSHLGQQRVCALITPGLETPSDFDGIVYIRMDEPGSWKSELERELRAAGMPIQNGAG